MDGIELTHDVRNIERVRQEMPNRAGDVGWYIVRIDDPSSDLRVKMIAAVEFDPSEGPTDPAK